MAPAFTIGLFLTLSNCFKLYDQNLTLTNGGPSNSTEMVAMNIFRTAFTQNELGLAQAKAVLFLVVVAGITLTQLYISKKRRWKCDGKKGAKYLILLVGVILAFIFLFPVYILVINSFKSLRDIYSDILAFPIGDMFTVANYLDAFFPAGLCEIFSELTVDHRNRNGLHPDVFFYGGVGAGEEQDEDVADYFYDILSFNAGAVSVCHASVGRGDGKCEHAQQGRACIYEYRFCLRIFDHDVSRVYQ